MPAPQLRRNAVDALAADNVWSVGGGRLVEHWDGSSWHSQTFPLSVMNDLRDVAALAVNDVWAVGNVSVSNGLSPLTFHWDGTSWSSVSSTTRLDLGATTATLNSVAAVSADDVWAVGEATIDGVVRTLIEHWDGSRWTVVPSPDPDPTYNALLAVAAVARNDVWAVGRAGHRTLIEHWDGTSWSVVPSPYGYQLWGVAAVSPADVWAVGATIDPGWSGRGLTMHWDGTNWSVVQPPLSRPLTGVTALPDGTVLAAGGLGHYLPLQKRCEIRVGDNGVLPASVAGIPFATTIAWSFDLASTTNHSVSDASGMGLFDSGLRAPGGSFTFTFPAAGTYALIDSATGRTSTVKVSMTAVNVDDPAYPRAGLTTSTFALKWAAEPARAGYVYDVQIKRPGTTTYIDYLAGTTAPSTSFTPDAGPGTYGFRARLRDTAKGKSLGWSSPRTISVS